MNNLSKLGILLTLAAFMLTSCTNKSNRQENKEQDESSTNQTIVDSHTSEISLDWAGVYEGTMPCADCEGIETTVELKDNLTFTAKFIYLGNEDKSHSYTNKGTFTWDSNGQIITLQTDNNETSQYKVGENHIILLNADGEVDTGELADFYILRKRM